MKTVEYKHITLRDPKTNLPNGKYWRVKAETYDKIMKAFSK